jgi:hypothetical protein
MMKIVCVAEKIEYGGMQRIFDEISNKSITMVKISVKGVRSKEL